MHGCLPAFPGLRDQKTVRMQSAPGRRKLLGNILCLPVELSLDTDEKTHPARKTLLQEPDGSAFAARKSLANSSASSRYCQR
jgi:hypothetical protein